LTGFSLRLNGLIHNLCHSLRPLLSLGRFQRMSLTTVTGTYVSLLINAIFTWNTFVSIPWVLESEKKLQVDHVLIISLCNRNNSAISVHSGFPKKSPRGPECPLCSSESTCCSLHNSPVSVRYPNKHFSPCMMSPCSYHS